jgi:uncharacterized tellurite resistance protein B-like protein
MGIFDKIFSSNSGEPVTEGYNPLSDYEAWVAILYASISVDGEVSAAEIDSILRLLLFKNKFADIDILPFYKNALQAKSRYGSKNLIDNSALLIKEEDRPTVLALAAELMFSDGTIADKEKELLEYIARQLGLEESLATKIIEVIVIKNKDNRILVD